MFQRNRPNSKSLSGAARPSGGDPWRTAGEPRPSEQGIWILSYLDVMTILFAFFVLLFAYQKAAFSTAGKVPTVSQSSVQSQAQNAPQGQSATEVTHQPAGKEAVDLAVSAMKSQAPAYTISRYRVDSQPPVADSESTYPMATPVPAIRPETIVGAMRLASAQSAQVVAKDLQKAMEGKPAEVVSLGREVRLEVSEAILFDPASADLSTGGGRLMDKVLPILKEQRGTVFVEGHTDNKPIANSRYPSNWELSTARATAVTRYLIGKGVASERIRAVGLADTHPRADNETYEGRARNRRVSLVLSVDQPGP